jgi:hypothetical protein
MIVRIRQSPDQAFNAFVAARQFALMSIRIIQFGLIARVWTDADMVTDEGFSPDISLSAGVRLSQRTI